MRLSRWAVVALIMIGVLCVLVAGITIKDFFATRRLLERAQAPGGAILAGIQAIAPRVAAAKVTGGRWDEASLTRITGVRPRTANTAVLHAENLGDPTREPMTPILVCRPSGTAAASLVRHRRWPNGTALGLFAGPHVRPQIEALLQLRYVLAIRSGEYEAPRLHAMNFTAGRYLADAFLFDIKDGRLLGGIAIAARNSRIVETRGTVTVETLTSDLATNARRALKQQLAEHLPGVADDEHFCPW